MHANKGFRAANERKCTQIKDSEMERERKGTLTESEICESKSSLEFAYLIRVHLRSFAAMSCRSAVNPFCSVVLERREP